MEIRGRILFLDGKIEPRKDNYFKDIQLKLMDNSCKKLPTGIYVISIISGNSRISSKSIFVQRCNIFFTYKIWQSEFLLQKMN